MASTFGETRPLIRLRSDNDEPEKTHPENTQRGKASVAFVVVLLIALVTRVACVALWQRQIGSDEFGFGDSLSYWQLARSIASGEPYEYGWSEASCFRTPGYPAFLAPLFLIWENPPVLAARALGVALGIAVVALTFAIAERFGSRRVAMLAALGVALSPELVFSSGLVLSETLFDLLLLSQLLVWLWRQEAASTSHQRFYAGLLGTLTAMSVLVRPSWLPAIIVWTMVLLLLGSHRRQSQRLSSSNALPNGNARGSIQTRVTDALLCVLLFAVVMSPWWIRNYQLYDRFIPTSLQTGASLWDGWNEGATGGSDMRGIDELRLTLIRQTIKERLNEAEVAQWNTRLPLNASDPDYWRKLKEHLPPLWTQLRAADPNLPAFELALDQFLAADAKRFASENPGRVVELAGAKFTRLWSPWPQEGMGRSSIARVAFGLGFLALMIGFVLGIRPALRSPDLWLLIAPALFFTLLHMIYVASIRYREPALPGLFIIAAIGWNQCIGFFRRESVDSAEAKP